MENQGETLDPFVQRTTQKLREGDSFRILIHCGIAASLLGAVGAYAFDAQKISLGFGCIALYLSVELICGVLIMGQDRMILINYLNMEQQRNRNEPSA